MNPKIPQRKFEPEYARELLRLADRDLDAAQALLRGNVKHFAPVFYMAEQVVEKSIKAVMCAHNMPILFTHDLLALIAVLPEIANWPFGPDVSELSEFATTRRYEEGRLILTAPETEKIIELAEQVMKWAEQQIEMKLN